MWSTPSALIHVPIATADLPPDRATQDRHAGHLPRGRPGCRTPAVRAGLPRAVATPFLGLQGRAKVWRNMAVTQLGIPPQIPRRRRSGTGLHRREHRRSLARHRNQRSGSSRRTRPSCGGTGPSTWIPTAARRGAAHPLGLPARHHHGRLQWHRPGAALRWPPVGRRCSPWPATAPRSTTCGGRDPRRRRPGARIHLRCDRLGLGGRLRQGHILGRFGHVDYLVNNAGRSIRRSVGASTDRLHDYERVMAVNYFGSVRMVLALLPHWRERRFGHVVNVSSAGACRPVHRAIRPTCRPKPPWMPSPRLSAPKRCPDHVTFTNIHMPLVSTPMITPSHRLSRCPRSA